jgi:class 3 adenylate cyclase/predicted ATPase
MSCGTALPGAPAGLARSGAPSPGATAGQPRPAPRREEPVEAEERRTVTILFADLSGYTAVAEQMDPESVKSLVDRSLHRLGEEVERFGGTIDKYMGDNVMAIFGAPVTHEDDAERAVRAGLAMLDAMAGVNEELTGLYGVRFALRVGINTGEVLAGRVGATYTVIGDSVNVASRLQAAARPGTVTVGERTYRATRGRIEYRPLAPLTLKGKTEPVDAWEAVAMLAPSETEPGLESTPFIGRGSELGQLQALYGRTLREHRPHLVTVIGEAGVGKSRLLREFERALTAVHQPVRVRWGRCLPYGSSVVYWPLGEVLRAECGIQDGDPAAVAWSKLWNRLGGLLAGEPADEELNMRKLALIATLLGIEAPIDSSTDDERDAQRTRDTFFAAVRSCVEGIAREDPLILAWEDIHWADQGMLDLIEYLAQWVRAPVLLVCLARDELLERRPEWGGARRSATTLFLDPLADGDTRKLVAALLPPQRSEPELVTRVTERVEGNPFFAEEMTRRLVEADHEAGGELPDTVNAVLAARIDSLEPLERRVVQQAAVVGRTFWEGSLAGVAGEEGDDLGRALSSLREKDILTAGEGSRLAGEPEFAFKHVLIRDVAYEMLPKAVRARKHFEVGGFIEERAGERGDEVVALVAEHYAQAAALGAEVKLEPAELGRFRAKALHFLEGAGDAATRFYSNEEALTHYGAARALAAAQDPALAARIAEKEGDVALRLGRVDTALTVWEECLHYHRGQEDLERVAELHRKIGSALAHKGERKTAIEQHQKGINLIKDGPPSLALVRLYEEAAWLYMQTGDNMLAIYASEKALRLAERLGEVRAASRAHGIFGRVFGRIGDTVKARENLERAVALARGSDDHETVLALLALGHHLEEAEAVYDEAATVYDEALGLAKQIGDVPAQIELHAASARLAFYRGDWDAVSWSSDESAQLAGREGLVGKLCLPYVLRGLLAWREGEWDASERLLRQAYELAEKVGWSEVAFSALMGVAVTLRDRGELGRAETALSQALDVCERSGLIGQSIQANSARAVVLVLADRYEPAREAAEEATTLADRVRYPVAEASALEATGAVTASARPEGAKRLLAAREAWTKLGRPIDAARCELLAGRLMLESDPDSAARALAEAAASYERLGIAHLAATARELASGPNSARPSS